MDKFVKVLSFWVLNIVITIIVHIFLLCTKIVWQNCLKMFIKKLDNSLNKLKNSTTFFRQFLLRVKLSKISQFWKAISKILETIFSFVFFENCQLIDKFIKVLSFCVNKENRVKFFRSLTYFKTWFFFIIMIKTVNIICYKKIVVIISLKIAYNLLVKVNFPWSRKNIRCFWRYINLAWEIVSRGLNRP